MTQRNVLIFGLVNFLILSLNVYFVTRKTTGSYRFKNDASLAPPGGFHGANGRDDRNKNGPELGKSHSGRIILGMPKQQYASQNDQAQDHEYKIKQNKHHAAELTRSYAERRKTYQVPQLKRVSELDCVNLLAGKNKEIEIAESIENRVAKIPIHEETYDLWTRDCASFKKERGYIDIPLTETEEKYPLAFSISMYKDVEHSERLLRAIYQPQNIYCFHIDTKTSLLIHRTMQSLVNCFDNVFIASHLSKVKWGDVSVLLPAINCMRDLVKYHRGKWKYFINLTGQEFPLRTNYELVKIAKIFNGSNDIAGSLSRMEMDRVKFRWSHRWSRTYQQTIFFNTYEPKAPFHINITFFKGELHGLFSHNMVEYIVENEVATQYLEWCWDSGHPTEHYWNVLNYNRHLRAPGGYEGPLDVADEYSEHPAIRAKHWAGHYNNRKCHGKFVRGICVYGIRDLPWIAKRKELVANKFHLTFHHLGYDCLEERHRNRTRNIGKVAKDFDEEFYRNLPTVKYSRKDGLSRL